MDTKGLQKEFISWCKSKNKSPKSEDETKLLFVAFMKEKHPEEYKKAVENQLKQQQAQTKKALHGAKLNYFKSLKNQCAEDEEVVYYKKGGSVSCGCKKKEDGGPVKKDCGGSVVKKFKMARKGTIFNRGDIDTLAKIDSGNNSNTNNSHSRPKPKVVNGSTKQPTIDGTKKMHEEKQKEEFNKRFKKNTVRVGIDSPRGTNNVTKKESEDVTKDKCGSKIKKHQEGSVIALFKAYRKGGSLNGIPFMQNGTPKGGFPTAPKAKDRYSRGTIKEENKDGRQTITITSRTPGYNANYLRNAAKIKRIVEGNDTAYIETPENGLLTKVLPRTAFKGYMGGTPYYSEYIEKNFGPFEHSLSRLLWTNNRIFPSEFKKLQERFNIAYNNAN